MSANPCPPCAHRHVFCPDVAACVSVYHVYCMLPFTAHHECFSGHAFSTDGHSWTFSKTEPFDGSVNFTDGTSTVFSTRERPKFVYSDENLSTPIALITGVSPQCSPPTEECCSKCNMDHSGQPDPELVPTCSQVPHSSLTCLSDFCHFGNSYLSSFSLSFVTVQAPADGLHLLQYA